MVFKDGAGYWYQRLFAQSALGGSIPLRSTMLKTKIRNPIIPLYQGTVIMASPSTACISAMDLTVRLIFPAIIRLTSGGLPFHFSAKYDCFNPFFLRISAILAPISKRSWVSIFSAFFMEKTTKQGVKIIAVNCNSVKLTG